jgi:hypothetical protein
MDFSAKSDSEIETWIENHERSGATSAELYKRLLEERARRNSSGLKVENSLRLLSEAASAEKFVTYGDLAKASGVPWSQARHAMNGAHGHLDRLLDICHARGMPLLTALCVNQQSVETGELSENSMAGFISGAKRLGYSITDAEGFFKTCQKTCFEWAKSRSSQSD